MLYIPRPFKSKSLVSFVLTQGFACVNCFAVATRFSSPVRGKVLRTKTRYPKRRRQKLRDDHAFEHLSGGAQQSLTKCDHATTFLPWFLHEKMFLIATALGNRLRRRRRIFILVCGAVLLLYTLLYIKHMSPTTIVGPPGSTESADAKHILGLMPVSAANVECSQPLPQSGSDKNRGLTVQKWFDLCGTAVENLRQSPLFPLFPHVVHHTCHFKPELNGDSGYAQRIFGFLHPPASGRYRFAIFSDGGSELWLSSDHRPANAKLLALVSLGSSPTWPTVHGDTSKYPSPISKEIYLEGNGTYFIEALHQHGNGDRHIVVYWKMPASTCFAVVHEAFLSPSHPRLDFTDAPKHRKESPVERRFMDNSAVELANKREINMALPTCDYEPSFIVRRPLKRYEGARLMRLVHPASVYPDDQTAFKSAKTENWSRGNERVDQGKAQVVAQKFIKAMEVRWPGWVADSESSITFYAIVCFPGGKCPQNIL